MNTLDLNVQELSLSEIEQISGGAAWPMWLKVSLTIGVAGAAGYAVGYYS